MKRLAILIVIFSFAFNAHATFVEGQSLRVLAKSGLNLRMSPVNGSSIDIIPFGAQVTVINGSHNKNLNTKVEWIDGNWILVEFEGQQGYVHDGFLTELPIPDLDFEHNQMEMDLIYPVEGWIDYNMGNEFISVDTTVNNRGGDRITHILKNGKYLKEDRGEIYKVELYLDNARPADIYQILMAMYEDPIKRNFFKKRTVFINDEKNDLQQINIRLDEFVSIRRMPNGQSRLRIITSERGCN